MIHVAGYFRDSTEVDADGPAPITLASAGELDVYVAAFDAAGTPIWARAYGGPGDDYATSASGLPDGSLFLTGVCHGAVDFDGAGPLAPIALPIDGRHPGQHLRRPPRLLRGTPSGPGWRAAPRRTRARASASIRGRTPPT